MISTLFTSFFADNSVQKSRKKGYLEARIPVCIFTGASFKRYFLFCSGFAVFNSAAHLLLAIFVVVLSPTTTPCPVPFLPLSKTHFLLSSFFISVSFSAFSCHRFLKSLFWAQLLPGHYYLIWFCHILPPPKHPAKFNLTSKLLPRVSHPILMLISLASSHLDAIQ